MEGLPMDFYAGTITTVAVLVSRTFCWDFRRAFGGKRRAPGHGLSRQFFLVDNQKHAKKAIFFGWNGWSDTETPHQGEVPFAYQVLSATLGREPIGLVNTAQEEQLRGRVVEGRQRTRVVGMAWIARFRRKFCKVLVPSESSERCNK